MISDLPNLYEIGVLKLPNNHLIRTGTAYGFSSTDAFRRLVNDILIHEYAHDPTITTVEMMRPRYDMNVVFSGGPPTPSGPVQPKQQTKWDRKAMKAQVAEHERQVRARNPNHKPKPCGECGKK